MGASLEELLVLLFKLSAHPWFEKYPVSDGSLWRGNTEETGLVVDPKEEEGENFEQRDGQEKVKDELIQYLIVVELLDVVSQHRYRENAQVLQGSEDYSAPNLISIFVKVFLLRITQWQDDKNICENNEHFFQDCAFPEHWNIVLSIHGKHSAGNEYYNYTGNSIHQYLVGNVSKPSPYVIGSRSYPKV